MIQITMHVRTYVDETPSPRAERAISSSAVASVLRERIEQIDKHGRTVEHDLGELPTALTHGALAYLTVADRLLGEKGPARANVDGRDLWPWNPDTFRPTPRTRPNLVKAAAMILAAIERLDAADPLGEQVAA